VRKQTTYTCLTVTFIEVSSRMDVTWTFYITFEYNIHIMCFVFQTTTYTNICVHH